MLFLRETQHAVAVRLTELTSNINAQHDDTTICTVERHDLDAKLAMDRQELALNMVWE